MISLTRMARISKAFVWLLTAYIITVIVLVNILRDNTQRSLEASERDKAELLRDIVEEHHGDNENQRRDKDDSSLFTTPKVTSSVYSGGEGTEGTTSDSKGSDGTMDTEAKDNLDDDDGIQYGPGENGTAVSVSDEGKRIMNSSVHQQRRKFHGFNTFVSDIVSLQRKVQDLRPEACKSIRYPADMKPASVVIIFRDEWPSVVLRTAYSVLGASPENLLKEIVLVDDGSADLELKATIDIHVSNVEKLKLVRNPTPLGLMLARQKGIEATTSEYFVVMDGHMEVGPGWLEPLISRLQEVPKALLCSHVGGVDQETFKFHVGNVFDGQFPFFDTLTLSQMWATYSSKYKLERNGSVDPMPMGTIQGMMAVMRKDFFLQLGGFDPGMRQWGSEQMELSIKVWMCGGRVELVPCSKVAHMYRITPWGKVNKTSDFLVANSLRTAEVWLDDPYKSVIRDVIGQHSQYDIGDLTDRHRIRKENNCKPFQYFVDMVRTFSDVYLLGDIKAKGNIRNARMEKCLYNEKEKQTKTYKLKINACSSDQRHYFILSEHDQIRSLQGTIIRTKVDPRHKAVPTIELVKSPAYSYMPYAVWQFRADGSLYNVATKLCMAVSVDITLILEECTGGGNQQWEWERVEGK